ncbi:hypothetical protein [Ornithinimicrobium sufpigmenti]|uniref:hypothetical protein n=1 Tax=Ornithinimicrobium sufpigmenti TaxID=2508882 RepID=UPI001035D6D4|nr:MULTISPECIES: hypothetical protein [unclassified Ornithinimicrobium]
MSRRRAPSIYPPSTGELMDRADLLARALLYDAPERDGRAMVRAWGEVVEGAADLWNRLPRRSDLPGTGTDIITQLERSARTLHRAAGQANQVDTTLIHIGNLFTRAAGLIDSADRLARSPGTRWTARQTQDAFAARINIMHTLYVSAHAITVSLAATAHAERWDARLRVHNITAEELQHQVADVEALTHSYLHGHYPTALHGRYRHPVDDTRLDTAIATWDVHAHQALTRTPTPDAMTQVAGAAFTATIHAHRLWRAAADSGLVRPDVFTKDIAPALETMTERWGHANTAWADLHHPQVPPASELREASWELVNAMREVTRDRVGPANTQTISDRIDMASLVRSLHRFHAVTAGIGDLFHETARHAQLTVNARPANDLTRQLIPSAENPHALPEGWPQPTPANTAVLSPRDVLLRRPVPLPEVLRPLLQEPARQAAVATRSALRATMTASDQKTGTMHVPSSWTSRHHPATTRLDRSQDHERLHLTSIPRNVDSATPGR